MLGNLGLAEIMMIVGALLTVFGSFLSANQLKVLSEKNNELLTEINELNNHAMAPVWNVTGARIDNDSLGVYFKYEGLGTVRQVSIKPVKHNLIPATLLSFTSSELLRSGAQLKIDIPIFSTKRLDSLNYDFPEEFVLSRKKFRDDSMAMVAEVEVNCNWRLEHFQQNFTVLYSRAMGVRVIELTNE